METQMQTTQSNVPAAVVGAPQQQILQSDIVIPKVMLMQALSDLVEEKKAQAGEMVRSSTGEKLGDESKPLDFIPLMYHSLWMLSEDVKGKGNKSDFEFRGYEPRVPLNERLEWDFERNGTKWRRTKTMHLFGLLPRDIDAQASAIKEFEETGEVDIEKALLPVCIALRNMSFKHAAKDVTTFFAKAESIAAQTGKAVPLYGATVQFTCKKEKNDKGAFYVFNMKPAGKTKPEYKAAAKTWFETLCRNVVKVDDSDIAEDAKEADQGPTNF